MTNTQGIGVYTPADAREIKRRVLSSDYTQKSPFDFTERNKLGWHYVILKEDLSPATNPLTGYTQANAAVLMYLETADTLDMEEVEGEENYIRLTNRSPFISGSVGDVALVRWKIKEWAVIWCNSSALRHGLVRSNLGCGYYVIELGVWTGDMFSAGSGVGSDPSDADIPDIDCDVCYDVTGRGTEACAIELHYPPVQVTGTGQYVIAYHRASALVPLHAGSACLLTGSGADQPSSSDDAPTNTRGIDNVWQIIDGLQDHTVQYIEEWDCCEPDGPETLLTRTPVIFAAKVCEAIPCGECPAPSSAI